MSTLRSLKCDGCGRVFRPGDAVLGLEMFRSSAEESKDGVWSGREVARAELDVCGDCVASPLLTLGQLAERSLRPVSRRRKERIGVVSVDEEGEDES